MRILVIDDDDNVRKLISDILMTYGHIVAEASDGISAMAIMKQGAFDLVITDLEMPMMSGWEVAGAIKAIDPDVVIALVTGWSEQLDATRLHETGISKIVHKPFRLDQIAKLAEEVQAKKMDQ